jgi:hypothetical protein
VLVGGSCSSAAPWEDHEEVMSLEGRPGRK